MSNRVVGIKSIKITLGDSEIELTMDEALKLKEELEKVFVQRYNPVFWPQTSGTFTVPAIQPAPYYTTTGNAGDTVPYTITTGASILPTSNLGIKT
jgi:hypothetical protein